MAAASAAAPAELGVTVEEKGGGGGEAAAPTTPPAAAEAACGEPPSGIVWRTPSLCNTSAAASPAARGRRMTRNSNSIDGPSLTTPPPSPPPTLPSSLPRLATDRASSISTWVPPPSSVEVIILRPAPASTPRCTIDTQLGRPGPTASMRLAPQSLTMAPSRAPLPATTAWGRNSVTPARTRNGTPLAVVVMTRSRQTAAANVEGEKGPSAGATPPPPTPPHPPPHAPARVDDDAGGAGSHNEQGRSHARSSAGSESRRSRRGLPGNMATGGAGVMTRVQRASSVASGERSDAGAAASGRLLPPTPAPTPAPPPTPPPTPPSTLPSMLPSTPLPT
ncbi:hypothetical protein I4F81_000111 [Pyropia yezoensis]|uniref:Uncharacterized protein n=1 Tax=Pyropia yezoensis TaxID=2788 RepID=A0ACC3BHZ4_PYRYE|nr:hypothetical protein I4F81_000111 [Neopyropia yezoensis]